MTQTTMPQKSGSCNEGASSSHNHDATNLSDDGQTGEAIELLFRRSRKRKESQESTILHACNCRTYRHLLDRHSRPDSFLPGERARLYGLSAFSAVLMVMMFMVFVVAEGPAALKQGQNRTAPDEQGKGPEIKIANPKAYATLVFFRGVAGMGLGYLAGHPLKRLVEGLQILVEDSARSTVDGEGNAAGVEVVHAAEESGHTALEQSDHAGSTERRKNQNEEGKLGAVRGKAARQSNDSDSDDYDHADAVIDIDPLLDGHDHDKAVEGAAASSSPDSHHFTSPLEAKHNAKGVSEDEYQITLVAAWLCRILLMIEVSLLAVSWQ